LQLQSEPFLAAFDHTQIPSVVISALFTHHGIS
jgi:hypothetical protein